MRAARRFGLLLVAVALLIGFRSLSAAPAQPEQRLQLRDQVARLAEPMVARGEAIGIAVGILDAEGETHHFGFGRIAKGENRVPDSDTLFELGSITKCFTGILLAEMLLKQEVRLDEPAQALVPRGVELPKVSGRPMTLEELATYSTGLPRMPANFGKTEQEHAVYSTEKMYEFLTGLARRERGGGPQRRYLYSNLGFALLGQCLAERAREPVRPLIVSRVARPLGMDSTVFEPGPRLEGRVAATYAQGRRVPPWETGAIAPAGMLRSTTRDMVKFMQANVGRAETPLKAALEFAQKPRYQTGVTEKARVNHEIGLAWFIEPKSGLVHHDGATAGSSANVVFHPGKKVGVVVLMNQAKSPCVKLSMEVLALLHREVDAGTFRDSPRGAEDDGQ